MSELKPCPFCGDVTRQPECYVIDQSQGMKYGCVQCGCGARGPDVRTAYNDKPDAPWHAAAAAEWNRRHPDAHPEDHT